MSDAVQHEVIVGVISAIVGGLLLPFAGRLLHGALLFIPHRIGDEFKNMAKFAPVLTKAKGDPLSAIAFVGAELGKMLVTCLIATLLAGSIYVIGTVATAWPSPYRTGAMVLLAIWFMGCVYHLGKRLLSLLLFYTEIYPPQIFPPAQPVPAAPPPVAPPKAP